MDWNLKILERRLSGKLFGRSIYYFPEIESTNDKAFSLGIDGSPEGTVVIADSQSRGRGRLQRIWHSPSRVNIYTSVVLRPLIKSSGASWIPLMAGVAAAEVLNNYCPGKINLKWPNDILLSEKKVCGILSQAKITRGKIDFIILGIGINVNGELNQFSEEIRGLATSLRLETNMEISRQELIIRLYENLEKWYKHFGREGSAPVKKRWLELTTMIGRTVQVIFLGKKIKGKAADLDEDGSLILFTAENRKIKVSAGDATIAKR